MKSKDGAFFQFIRIVITALLAVGVVDYLPRGRIGHGIILGLAVIAFSSLTDRMEAAMKRLYIKYKPPVA